MEKQFYVAFQRDRTVQLFGTKGQAKNLAKGRDGLGQPKSGTGRGTKRDRAEKDVLKQKINVQQQERVF